MDDFSIQNGPFALNKHFIRPRVTKICLFSDPKWAICPNENFSKKKLLINIAPIIHVYLHSKNSKVKYQSTNEIMTIKEY